MALRALAVVAGVGLFLLPRVARADCPDGWFCDEKPAAAPPPPAPPNAQRVEPPGEEAPEPDAAPPAGPDGASFVVPPYDENPPPPPAPWSRSREEIGLNFHFGIGVLGSGAHHDAFMGGGGFAFRLRPIPAFALDLGLELAGGTDYNGNQRGEYAGVVNALGFLNPRDRVQCYALGGFHLGGASVTVARLGGVAIMPYDDHYAYIGGQVGLGLEWRVTRHTALASDFQMFIRGRIDEGRQALPEFVDPSTHLTSNVSGGGLFRLGVTFYF
jgi:hypothetical protein